MCRFDFEVLCGDREPVMGSADYQALGGHLGQVVRYEDVVAETGGAIERRPWPQGNPWPRPGDRGSQR